MGTFANSLRIKFTDKVLNNFIFNFIIRILGLEEMVYRKLNPYHTFKPSPKRTTQENAGYSDRPEINEVLERSKKELLTSIREFCKEKDQILDVGCGPGMYLSLLKDTPYQLTAIDINSDMLDACKILVPEAKYYKGEVFEIEQAGKFNFIYCIGVLIYIPRHKIVEFIEKVHQLLAPNGIFYLNYPHAISRLDTLYHDLTYIKYSPEFIEKIIEPYFKILKHEHAFDGRKIRKYDTNPYTSLNKNTDRTYKNSYLLIAQKK